ncbi:MAG TPA: PfkB family carbohydrate kinase, partial [Aggregatilineales bacterium]|nr:PfkB family carbohydrate kinase [Aggregatilineales bacterium]
FGATPRVGVTIFDRQGSAASKLGPDDFDWDVFLKTSRAAHTDGIFPGLSDSCRAAAAAYLQAARRNGCLTTFDLNYREHLWTEKSARQCWETLLPYVDVLVTNRSASEAVFDFRGTDEAILSAYKAAFGCKVICLTSREIPGILRGAWSSQALVDGQVIQGPRFEFDVIDRFGTGDAFLAGLVYGYLEQDAAFGLAFGNAACALAHTIEGDVVQFSAAEVLPLLNDKHDLRVRR